MNLRNFHKALGPIMLAGGYILGIGLYYLINKAGIPYQDAPLDLEVKYMVNMGIGETLTKMGAATMVSAYVGRAVITIILRKKG